MKRSTRAAVLASIVAVLTGLISPVGVTAQSPSPAPADEGTSTFTIGTTEDLTTPNPFKAGSSPADYEYFFLVYDMMLNYSREDLSPIPALAESWEVSEDGKTYTFKIRDDATWSDGTPMTAEDVAFTFNFIWKNEGTGAFNDYLGFPKSFSAPNPTTFVWEMEKATIAPVSPPYVPILPKHIWEKFEGTDAATLKAYTDKADVGTGPYRLAEWKQGEFLRFEARDDYWGPDPVADVVTIRIFENQEAMVQALKNGDVDALNDVAPALFDSLKGEPNIETWETMPNYLYNFAFNLKEGRGTGHPALQDPVMRRAIAHAIDKEQLVNSILQGYGEVGDSFLLPMYGRYYLPAEGEEKYPFDLAKANQMLDDAGYLDTDGDGVREMPNGGEPLNFELVTLTDDQYSTDVGKLIEAWLEELGWNVTMKPVSTAKAYQLWADSEFDAYVWGWSGDPDPNFMLSIFTTNSCYSWSDGCYSNAEYDQMYEEQQQALTYEERKPIVDEMQRHFYAEVPEVILFYTKQLQAFRTDRWTNMVPAPQPNGAKIYSWGPWTYFEMKPASAAVASGEVNESGGSAGLVWIAIIGAVVVVIAVVLAKRRRRNEDELE